MNILFGTNVIPVNYVIIEGRRQSVVQVCQDIICLVDNHKPTDDGVELKLVKENFIKERELPHRIWPAGHVRQTVDINASYLGFIIGKEGKGLANLRNRYSVDIHVPLKDEEYKLIDFLGRSENAERVKRKILQMVTHHEGFESVEGKRERNKEWWRT